MPPKHRFYDPFVQNPSPETGDQEPDPVQLEAIYLSRPGVYLPLEGAIAYLHAAADEWDRDGNPSGALALRAVADAWTQALPETPVAPVTETPTSNGEAAPESNGGEIVPDQHLQIPPEGLIVSVTDPYRIEIFPDDPEAPRPRWHARSVDDMGRILFVTGGSFDQQYVEQDARERWPGKDIFYIADASVDTVWEEQAPTGVRGVHTHRRRPSPNRLWG